MSQMPLTEFRHNGFVVFPHVLPASEMQPVAEQLISPLSGRSRAGVRHAMRHGVVAEMARHPALLGIARAILGPNAFPLRATLFDKSPKANWLVVWHQDTALPLQERKELPGWGPWSVKDGVVYAHAPADALSGVVALRLHLDDASRENGCLRVLPGSHRSGVLSDAEIEHLAKGVQPYDCVVPKGGVLVMSPLTVHSSSKSRVAKRRRVLHLEYAASRFPAEGLELAVA